MSESVHIFVIIVIQFAEGYEELEFLADSLGEYLLAGNEKCDERSEFWKSQSN